MMNRESQTTLAGDDRCPAYATCERINRVFSHEIPACMAIRMSEEVCHDCTEKTTPMLNPKS